MTTLKRPKKWMTGDEHDAWLKETGQYEAVIETQRKYHEELEKRRAARDAALVPLMDELDSAGCSISESGYLMNQPNIPTAISIILAHLQRTTYPTDARDFMSRALFIPDVKTHWTELLRLFREEREERVKDGLANAIVEGVDKETFDDVIALVRDKSNGTSRVLLLYLFEKTKDPRGRATMEELADDPDLAVQIGISLKKLDQNALKRAERQALKNPTRQARKPPTRH